MKTKKKKLNTGSGRGGPRPHSGRKPKLDKAQWGKITCILKNETIQTLHDEGGIYFGEYLQAHLDRYPLPTKAEYEAMTNRQPVIQQIRGRKVPVIISAGGLSKFIPKVRKPKGPFARAIDPQKFESALTAALKNDRS
jgi:hypothetical protein